MLVIYKQDNTITHEKKQALTTWERFRPIRRTNVP